jgi:mannose-6-phosphate isomerase-like protein (cupin superfamily)
LELPPCNQTEIAPSISGIKFTGGFYCCKGHVLLFDEQKYYELFGGDAIFIPEGLPHTLINIGEETAVLVWAGAPGE